MANLSLAGNRKKSDIMIKVILNIFLAFLAFLVLIPLFWMLMNSVKTNQELFDNSLRLPSLIHFENYATAWRLGLSKYFINSLLVSTVSILLIVMVSSLVAYGLTRFAFRGRFFLFVLILGGMTLSEQVALVPLFKILQILGIYNTPLALILPYVAFRIPFSVFLIRAYFISIPRDLEEAAYIDGYNSFQIFTRIIIPISKPVLSSCALVTLNFVWNEFMFALVFLEDEKWMTIPIGLMTFKGQLRTDYTVMLAGITIATIPMLITFLFLQKQFLRGLTAGSLKE